MDIKVVFIISFFLIFSGLLGIFFKENIYSSFIAIIAGIYLVLLYLSYLSKNKILKIVISIFGIFIIFILFIYANYIFKIILLIISFIVLLYYYLYYYKNKKQIKVKVMVIVAIILILVFILILMMNNIIKENNYDEKKYKIVYYINDKKIEEKYIKVTKFKNEKILITLQNKTYFVIKKNNKNNIIETNFSEPELILIFPIMEIDKKFLIIGKNFNYEYIMYGKKICNKVLNNIIIV